MENTDKLDQIYNLIVDYIACKQDMLVSTQRLLDQLLSVITETKDMTETIEPPTEPVEISQVITVSCDASIKKNPGGPAAVGVVVRFPEHDKPPLKFHKFTPALTNNEAEYDAIYEGLLSLSSLTNKPRHPIVVRSDSQLVVRQLKGEYAINEAALQRRFDSIHELAGALPVSVLIEWHPRNSTPDLTESNFLAQDALKVRRH